MKLALSALLAAALLSAPAAALAQAQPAVVATRILAIGHLTPKMTADARRTILPSEVRATVQLYLNGKIDQWYSLQDGTGVAFILNVTDLKEAHDMLEALPLGQAGMMEFQLTPLGPLNPLRVLAAPPAR